MELRFNGKPKTKKKNKEFTHNLIFKLKAIFSLANKEQSYKTSKKSKRFMGIIRNSIYSMKFGHTPIERGKLNKKGKHKALRKTIAEINDAYSIESGNSLNSSIPLNLVGSSYGSTLLGQIVLELIEEYGLKIKTLTLSACPIDPNSSLGSRLVHYENTGKIEKIYLAPKSK